jgi:diketogulonate reductase-like aldo/keto reductase
MNLMTKSGKSLFPIGIGTWGISSDRDNTNNGKYDGVYPIYGNEDEEIKALRYSLDKGQNHIDCAELYGGFYTDEVVGRAIESYTREDLFIADKLWKTSIGTGKVKPTVDTMLSKLKTTYIDILYIHEPWDDTDWKEAITQIDDLIDTGIIRYFGVSNFSLDQLQEASKISRHGVAAVQQNFNVIYHDEVNNKYITYCKQNNIALVAYQPLKRHEVEQDLRLKSIAKKYNATPSQIALSWLLAVGALPIPKSTNKNHIDLNYEAASIALDKDDVDMLTKY